MTTLQKKTERNRRYYVKKFGARPSDLGAHIYLDPSVPRLIAGSGLHLPQLQYYAYRESDGWKTGPADGSPSMRISPTMTFGFVYSIVTKYCDGAEDTVWFCTSPGVIGGPCREHPSPHELVLPSLPSAMSGKVSWLCQQNRTRPRVESPPPQPDPLLEPAPVPRSEVIADTDAGCESESGLECAPDPTLQSDDDDDDFDLELQSRSSSSSSGCHAPEAKMPRVSPPLLTKTDGPPPPPDPTPATVRVADDVAPLCCDECKESSEDCDIFRTTKFKQCCTPCLLNGRRCQVQGHDVEREASTHIVPASCLVTTRFPAPLPPSYEIPQDKISTQKFRSRDVRGIVRVVRGKMGAEYILALAEDQPDQPATFCFVRAASQTRRSIIPIELREQFVETKDVVFLSEATVRGSLQGKHVRVEDRRARCESEERRWPIGAAYGCALARSPPLHPVPSKCPKGHPLLPDVEAFEGGTCDGCKEPVTPGSSVMQCKKCDWYLCSVCLPCKIPE